MCFHALLTLHWLQEDHCRYAVIPLEYKELRIAISRYSARAEPCCLLVYCVVHFSRPLKAKRWVSVSFLRYLLIMQI